jgi:PAS domain S-box-containing protein
MAEHSLKILLLEDSIDDAGLITRVIKKSGLEFIAERVDTREEYIASIKNFDPDIILSDHSLPQFNSMEALKICKKESPMIPFILVTGTVSEEFAVECLTEGADDYLLKGNLTRLPSAILSAIKKKQNEIEKNMAVEILKKSEEHFRGLIENSTDIFAIIDSKSFIQYLSPSVKRILGYKVDELKYKNIKEFVHPDDVIYTQKIVENFYSSRDELSFTEFRFKHKNNSWRHLECVSQPDKRKEFLIVNIRDITERKQAEQDLKSKNTELEKINKELDSFVYSASHDLRAPLKSVLGLVNLSKMDYEMNNFSSLTEYTYLIENCITKLDDTIQKIINYSGNARSEVVLEPIYFEEIINEIFEKLKYIPRYTMIKKTISVENDGSFVSDKGRIVIIFNNLISNAIKYSNPAINNSFINIDIKIASKEAVIIFEDNGIGINEKYIDKIFNMFYRATEKSDGSGLGLYIVKEIIDKLKGKIEVSSILGKGTKFTIRIPEME